MQTRNQTRGELGTNEVRSVVGSDLVSLVPKLKYETPPLRNSVMCGAAHSNDAPMVPLSRVATLAVWPL